LFTVAAKPDQGLAHGRRGWCVDFKSKKELAVEFINVIRAMDPSKLNRLISGEAGDDLAQFFFQYSANLISKDPSRVVENTSSLMLMGYLIRSHEEKKSQFLRGPLQPQALA
jgi:hypothetical protein